MARRDLRRRGVMARIRLAYALEAILALAVGLSLARAVTSSGTFEFLLESKPTGSISWAIYIATYIKAIGGAICTGVALTEGVALWIEVARKRSPAIWGLGRWMWSTTSMALIFQETE